MTPAKTFILGEFTRTLDDRFRLSVPAELADPLMSGGEEANEGGADCILAKERSGALSLWSAANWSEKLDAAVALVQHKMTAGRLEGRIEEVQNLGRLLSTRHRNVQLAGRGRLVIPEGFREFLGVEPGGEVLLVGAAVCVEIWRPSDWMSYLEQKMPQFGQLLDDLSG